MVSLAQTSRSGRWQLALARLEAWTASNEAWVFGLVGAIHLIPIWAFTYFPSLDGPAHLAIVQAWIHYDDPATPVFRELLELTATTPPNYFIYVVLYLLMLVVPPLAAEKLLLSLLVVLLPWSLRYAARALDPRAGIFGLFGFPFAFNTLVFFGFFNTSFAIAFFLFGFGFWLRRRDRADATSLAGYAVIGAAAYVCHLSALGMICLAIACTTIGHMGIEAVTDIRYRRFDARTILRKLFAWAVLPALGFAPVLALAFGYLMSDSGAPQTASGIAAAGVPSWQRLSGLIGGSVLVGLGRWEFLVSAAFLVSLRGLVWSVLQGHNRGRLNWLNGLLVCFLAFLLFYLVTPYQFHVRWMPTRLMPYVFLALLLWFASLVPGAAAPRVARLRSIVVGAVAVMTVIGVPLRAERFWQANDLLAELLSGASMVAPNSTILALQLDWAYDGRAPSHRVNLFVQLGSLLAVERQSVDIKNFQMHTRAVPVVFRREAWPHAFLAPDAALIQRPLETDVLGYAEATGRPIDYVLLMGGADAFPNDSDAHRLTAQLAEAYELLHVSPRHGYARLYRYAGVTDPVTN